MHDPARPSVEPATILLHKPVGYDAIEGRKPAVALIRPETRWDGDVSGIEPVDHHFRRLTPRVPLDRDASGLVVYTQDGRVWRRLTEDAALIEHEYIVEVSGEMAPWGLNRLNQGSCKVSWQNEIRLRFAIKGTRPGLLRDMCAQVGLGVVAIRRIRIGKEPLAKMPVGTWRYFPPGAKF